MADAAHTLASWCAAVTGRLEAPGVGASGGESIVPRLNDLASGDQVWVVGRDLIGALTSTAETADRVESAQLTAELLRQINSIRAVA